MLPVRVDLAALLRDAKGEAGEGEPVVKHMPGMPAHRGYLVKAQIAWLDNGGRRADVHAMRHSYGTLLSIGGVSPREAMSLMRHTDMRLSMRTYTDPKIFDLAGAVEKLPINLSTPDELQSAKATGTDGGLPGITADGGAIAVRRDEGKHGDGASGCTKSVTTPRAGLGYGTAGIGGDDSDCQPTLTLVTGGIRQQKIPSGGDGVNARQEPLDTLANFNEIGAWKTRYLHQARKIEIHPWKAQKDLPVTRDMHPGVKACPIERARQLQARIDSGEVKNRSELAAKLGVSRARVSQILGRLNSDDRQVG